MNIFVVDVGVSLTGDLPITRWGALELNRSAKPRCTTQKEDGMRTTIGDVVHSNNTFVGYLVRTGITRHAREITRACVRTLWNDVSTVYMCGKVSVTISKTNAVTE